MNKYKKLAVNTVIFAICSFSSKILVLMLTRLYTTYISPEDSSTKELLEITANFLIPIFTFSISNAIIRYGLDQKYDKRKIFTSSCGICFAGMLILFIISPILKNISFLNYIDGYTIYLLIYICTSSFRELCQQFIRSRELLKLYSFDGILTTLLLFLFNIIFISNLNMGVQGFMLSVICSDLCSGIFLFTFAKLHVYLKPRYFDLEIAKIMLKFSLPLIPTAVMWIITGFSDRIFIRYMESDTVFLGESAAGLYGYASKIPNLILMVSTIFFQAWNMSAITENDSKDRSQFYQTVYSAYQAILYIASAFLIALVQPITSIFVSTSNFEEYSDVYIYTPILVIAVLLMSLNQFLSSIYTATCHTQNSAWTSLVACIVNIAMNIILIPVWGIQGACIATFLSYLACFLIRIVDARKLVYFKVNHFNFIFSHIALLGMSYVIIASPNFKIFYLICGLLFVVTCNYKDIMLTVGKFLKIRNK